MLVRVICYLIKYLQGKILFLGTVEFEMFEYMNSVNFISLFLYEFRGFSDD